MNSCFCTIAVGESYLNSAVKLASKLKLPAIIVTNKYLSNKDNIRFFKLPEDVILTIQKRFNYGLKFYPIRYAQELGFDPILYIDADWELTNKFSLDNLYLFFKEFENSPFDMLFERPHLIGGHRKNKDVFWKHKIEIHNLHEVTKYDKANVVNEQFFVFKNTPKLKKFTYFWEKKNKIVEDTNTHPLAEGVEIGMSCIDSNLEIGKIGPYKRYLRETFKFKDKSGNCHYRF